MNPSSRQAKAILSSVLFFGAVSYPVLSIVNKKISVAGIPVIYVYVFAVWILMIIALIALNFNRSNRKK